MTYRRRIQRVVHQAEALGWNARHNKHTILTSPEGRTVCLSGSPRDADATWKNTLADLRKAGFPIETLTT